MLEEAAALRGCHELVIQVSEAAAELVKQHLGALLKQMGAVDLALKLASAFHGEDLLLLLDDDSLVAHEDDVFVFLKEWTAKAGLPLRANPWAACRFAFLSAECLVEAALLEGTCLSLHAVSLSVALGKLLEEKGAAVCQNQLCSISSMLPNGWLQMNRLHPRQKSKLRKPIPGELILDIHCSTMPLVVIQTSECKTTPLSQLKLRLCEALGLEPCKVHMW
ncbi:unnamed protein product, partial [Polarella glacialis]